jgi:hypothetical protein
VKTLLLTSVAALCLPTGAAHTTEHFVVRCAGHFFAIYGHHGYSFSTYPYPPEGKETELPERLFHFRDRRDERTWFYRGHKCKVIKDLLAPNE